MATLDTQMTTRIDGLTFIAERTFEAPRDLVFEAFSDCRHLTEWWAPKGWTVSHCDMDFREGGVWHYCMLGPDGTEAWGLATYGEIARPERFSYLDQFADRDGTPSPEMPKMDSTVRFAERDRRTTVTNRTSFASAEDLKTVLDMGMESGLTETWDRLESLLARLQGSTAVEAPR